MESSWAQDASSAPRNHLTKLTRPGPSRRGGSTRYPRSPITPTAVRRIRFHVHISCQRRRVDLSDLRGSACRCSAAARRRRKRSRQAEASGLPDTLPQCAARETGKSASSELKRRTDGGLREACIPQLDRWSPADVPTLRHATIACGDVCSGALTPFDDRESNGRDHTPALTR